MIGEWSATLTLTEASSKELMRILKEQDEAFINNLLNGKCGFTLTSTDGRSVELVPKIGQTEQQNVKSNLEPFRVKKPCATCEYHDWEWDDHIGYRNICKGIGKCPYNVEETVTSEPQIEHTPTNVETMSCQECKWHFTDGNESYCQRDYYDMPCKYEERR